jgi:adenylate cyclase
MSMNPGSWQYFLLIILIYSFFMTLVINFILQVNKKFGPGVLLPLLLGKYRNPKEEERIFMFMDLKSSTTIAESIGHLHYSRFIRQQFRDRSDYYIKNHGRVPQFKAGLYMGKVTPVEIGEIKRDIAYHGDTLYTAARIQGMCNEYDKKLLVSGYFFDVSNVNEPFQTEKLGMIKLKGKVEPVGLWSVEVSANR